MVDTRMFSKECVIGSKTWLDIGKLIYLISKGSNEGYKLWLRYTKSSKNYDETKCYEQWYGFDEFMPEDYESDSEEESEEWEIPADY